MRRRRWHASRAAVSRRRDPPRRATRIGNAVDGERQHRGDGDADHHGADAAARERDDEAGGEPGPREQHVRAGKPVETPRALEPAPDDRNAEGGRDREDRRPAASGSSMPARAATSRSARCRQRRGRSPERRPSEPCRGGTHRRRARRPVRAERRPRAPPSPGRRAAGSPPRSRPRRARRAARTRRARESRASENWKAALRRFASPTASVSRTPERTSVIGRPPRRRTPRPRRQA